MPANKLATLLATLLVYAFMAMTIAKPIDAAGISEHNFGYDLRCNGENIAFLSVMGCILQLRQDAIDDKNCSKGLDGGPT
jgi:uncharacterized membrane protein